MCDDFNKPNGNNLGHNSLGHSGLDKNGLDYDKREWQDAQAARDTALEKQREKERKTRERSARNAKRKLERLQAKLKETGELSEWEDEFSTSVSERLEKYGSAFQDGEKGRSGDALSFAQKKVIASLKAKVKNKGGADSNFAGSSFKNKGFKAKGKNSFTPRVRRIEDDMPPAPSPDTPNSDRPNSDRPNSDRQDEVEKPRRAQRPFLRLVKNENSE